MYIASQTGRKTSFQLRNLDLYLMSSMKDCGVWRSILRGASNIIFAVVEPRDQARPPATAGWVQEEGATRLADQVAMATVVGEEVMSLLSDCPAQLSLT